MLNSLDYEMIIDHLKIRIFAILVMLNIKSQLFDTSPPPIFVMRIPSEHVNKRAKITFAQL